MAPAKDKRIKKKGDDKMTPKEPMSKDQKAVAKWLRRNVPTKNTKFMHSHKVDYFTGQVAVDKLMEESPWAKKNVKDPENQLYFEYREECVNYLDDLLKHKMFHRAKKIPVDDKFLKSKKKKTKETEETDGDAGSKSDAATALAKAGKKKRKIRLDMHLEQLFLDSKDAYVWIYDPTPWYYWVGGGAIVLITIAVCLFPLWPPWMRLGVHYLSIAAAGFLVFIIALGIVKYIIFAILFALSAGKLRFWIFPNLTEDVGFFESFWPIYDYTYTGAIRSKAKDSDDEESDDEPDEKDQDDKVEALDNEKNEEADQSESDDSTSKKSSVAGKDFEMVDKQEDTDA